MRVRILDQITGPWAKQWVVCWFVTGVLVLVAGFLLLTPRSLIDAFYLMVSLIGMCCVVSLSFRKNRLGNGLGMVATSGEIMVQATFGAVGMVMAHAFGFLTHVFGLYHWSLHQDASGNMAPKKSSVWVWVITACFIIIGLTLFPYLNAWLAQLGQAVIENSNERGIFYWLNITAFVLAVTAQVTMILRYPFSWGIWITVNCLYFTINLMSGNLIFALQSLIYQVNAIVGLYEWQRLRH